MKAVLNYIKNNKYEFAILILVFAYLYPVLNSGFYYDDALNSLIHGAKVNENAHLFDYIKGAEVYWFIQGRVFPLGPFIVYPLFELIAYMDNGVFFYKLYIVLLTMANVWLCGVAVEKVTRSKRLKLFAMLVLPVFFQIAMSTFNALYSFHGLLQYVMLFGLLSLIFMVNAIEKHKTGSIALSTIFMACSMLLYEVGFMFIIALFIVTYIEKDRKFLLRIRSILPQLIMCAIIFFVNVYARKNAVVETYGGVAVSVGSIRAIIVTFLKQFSGSLPLTQTVASRADLLQVNNHFGIQHLICLLLFAVLAYVVVLRVKENDSFQQEGKRRLAILFLIGCVFIAIPCALISISARYQAEIHFGAAHLPVYAEWIGMALITTVLFSVIGGKIRKTAVMYALCLIIGLPVIFININTMNAFFDDTRASNVVARAAYENAIKDGFYQEIDESSLLVYDNSLQNYAVPNKDFFANYANRRIAAQDIGSYIEAVKNAAVDKKTFYTKEIFYDAEGAIVLMGNLLPQADGSGTNCFITNARLYIYVMNTSDAQLTVSYNDYSGSYNYVKKQYKIRMDERKKKGAIISLESDGYIDINSIAVR